MNLHDLVNQLIIDTIGGGGVRFAQSSLGLFRPEIVICLAIVSILVVRMLRGGRNVDSAWIALLGAVIALYFVSPWRLSVDPRAFSRVEIFGGMLVHDGFSIFMRGVLFGFLILFIVLTKLSGIPDQEDGPDIYVLVLGATLGFCLMVSANHLLMVFMAVEMASVPSYVLAGLLKRDRLGSEAALKYSVYGAGAAGIMLYGISLLAGLVNTAHLPTITLRLAHQLPHMTPQELTVLALACLMILVGLAFKLSAVPFHFWCPDVFEGAVAEIGGFLSVASKAAALGLLVRLVIGIGVPTPRTVTPATASRGSQALVRAEAVDAQPTGLFAIADEVSVSTRPTAARTAADAKANDQLQPLRYYLGRLIALLAVITCTFGNLAAYGQTNIKRLLAYSTIAHAGYMMMAVPALLAMTGVNSAGARYAVAALGIYIVAYVFMNLGAFAVVAFLRNRMHSEQVEDYAGLLRRAPGVALCFTVILLGLIGLPPLSGFIGKFAIFAALIDGFRYTGQPYLVALVIIGGVNSTISLFYYLRIVKLMTMRPEPETHTPFTLPIVSAPGVYVFTLMLPTAVMILFWNSLNVMVMAASRYLVP